MTKINEVLRLRAAGLTVREIARSTGAGRTTVHEYLVRADAVGLSWPLPQGKPRSSSCATSWPCSAARSGGPGSPGPTGLWLPCSPA
jgi:hypothetical protein